MFDAPDALQGVFASSKNCDNGLKRGAAPYHCGWDGPSPPPSDDPMVPCWEYILTHFVTGPPLSSSALLASQQAGLRSYPYPVRRGIRLRRVR